ncbi:MAG: hypothetical protein JSR58_00505 [Verrucomicrobia bacterium]|nr:hypothetical protein [Verrucomicrobiota bacterium]
MLWKIAICLTLGAQLMALSCSTPQSLTRFEPKTDIYELKLFVNDNKDAAVLCNLKETDGIFYLVAQNALGAKWSEPYVLAKSKEANAHRLVGRLDTNGNVFAAWQLCENSMLSTERCPIQWAMKTAQEMWCLDPQFYSYKGHYFHAMAMDPRGKIFYVGSENKHMYFSILDRYRPCCESLFVRIPESHYCIKSDVAYGQKEVAFAAWITQQTIAKGWSTSVQYTFEGLFYKGSREWSSPVKIYEMTLPDTNNIPIVMLKVILDSQDNPTIVWQQYEKDKSKLRAMTHTKEGWIGPHDLCELTSWIADLQLAYDKKDNLAALWYSHQDGKAFVHVANKPASQEWLPSKIIRNAWVKDPRLASDLQGHFLAVWREEPTYDSNVIWGSIYSEEFSAWSKPVQLSPQGKYSHPAIAFTEAGKGYIAWIQEGEKKEIQVAEISLR